MIIVQDLFVYPLKSARGIRLSSAEVDERGLNHDRQFLVVDEKGMFVAQRRGEGVGVAIQSMCLIETHLGSNSLTLKAPQMPGLHLPLDSKPNDEIVWVQIWKDTCLAQDQGVGANEWITRFLSRYRPGKYRLMRIHEAEKRKQRRGSGIVGFADADSELVISQASVDDLNSRMGKRGHGPVPMNRFRPNIVLEGCLPYEEDGMAEIEINNVTFEGTTLCVRCTIPMIDQHSAKQGTEPITTLAEYRRHPGYDNKIVFGRNSNHTNRGTIKVAQEVKVVRRDNPWAI